MPKSIFLLFIQLLGLLSVSKNCLPVRLHFHAEIPVSCIKTEHLLVEYVYMQMSQFFKRFCMIISANVITFIGTNSKQASFLYGSGGLHSARLLFSVLLSSSHEFHVLLVMYDVRECLLGTCKTERALKTRVIVLNKDKMALFFFSSSSSTDLFSLETFMFLFISTRHKNIVWVDTMQWLKEVA